MGVGGGALGFRAPGFRPEFQGGGDFFGGFGEHLGGGVFGQVGGAGFPDGVGGGGEVDVEEEGDGVGEAGGAVGGVDGAELDEGFECGGVDGGDEGFVGFGGGEGLEGIGAEAFGGFESWIFVDSEGGDGGEVEELFGAGFGGEGEFAIAEAVEGALVGGGGGGEGVGVAQGADRRMVRRQKEMWRVGMRGIIAEEDGEG